jgi:hypothetical protein
MRYLSNGLILTAMIFVLNTTAASALDLDSNIIGIFTDSSMATAVPNLVIDADGNATADIAAGNVVLLGIDVSNAPEDEVAAIFATTTLEGSQWAGSLGAALPPSMLKAAGFGTTSLANVNTGDVKGNSPAEDYGDAGELWIQSVSYALQAGASGTGPDQIQIALVLGGVATNETVLFPIGMTPGDAIVDTQQIPLAVTFEGATINAPEPGSFALALASLGTVGLVTRIRRRA